MSSNLLLPPRAQLCNRSCSNKTHTRCCGVGVRASSRASFGIVCCPGGNHEPRVHEPRVHEPRVQAPPTGGGRWAERGRWGSGGARRWYASGAVTWGHGSLDVTVPLRDGARGEKGGHMLQSRWNKNHLGALPVFHRFSIILPHKIHKLNPKLNSIRYIN